MPLPNLFVPGAMKSGTTTLHHCLGRHPDIFMSRNKEPNFWADDNRYPDFEGYEKLFVGSENHRYRGESSTGYMVFDPFIERVKQHLEHPKFIFVLRNPAERAWSHYWFLRGMGYENRAFRAAFLADKDESPDVQNAGLWGKSRYYYQFGLYGKRLSRFYAQFGRDQILVITAENLFEKQAETLSQCFDFLGLEPLLESIPTQTINETTQLRHPKLYFSFVKNVLGDSLLKDVATTLLPVNFRRKLRERMVSGLFNWSKTAEKRPDLPAEERAWLTSFYPQDLERLRVLTGLEFVGW